MAQAKAKSITPAPAIDPATLPPRYRMKGDGDCMSPEIADGATIECTIDMPKPGDIAVIWLRPECAGRWPAIVKRLVMAPSPSVTFPWREHPESTVAALMLVESIDPPRRYWIRCEHVLALHKCVGVVRA